MRDEGPIRHRLENEYAGFTSEQEQADVRYLLDALSGLRRELALYTEILMEIRAERDRARAAETARTAACLAAEQKIHILEGKPA